MTELRKFSLKSFCFAFVTMFCIAITWKSEARYTRPFEIYSTLTSDTTPIPKKILGQVSPVQIDTSKKRDTTRITDTIPPTQKVDTFSLRLSKDTLDAPVNYEAEDSAVLFVKDQKFLLYGKTKTTYKDVVLTAPRVEMDQQTNIVTAYSSKDSLGNMIARAQFQQGQEGFQSDTIVYNFKTQKGLTKNTYTKQQEMFVQATLIKKVNDSTTFAKRVIMTTCDFDDPHFGFVSNRGKFITNKIAVTGPIHPEFEGVPIPIYLPFGIFPLNKGRHSGLLPPQFAMNEQFGIGLEGLGYYHVLNDYIDVTLRGNIYSYGGWSFNLTPSYRKRYKYNGALNISVQHTKFAFKGDPDFSLTKTFNVSWNHSVDSRAKPGTNFSANVNAGSTRYNQYIPNNPRRNVNNNQASSISYSKSWAGKPYNLSLNANQNQNSVSHLMNITLPDASFNVTTLYPFQSKLVKGTQKWYEKIGIGYTGVARNQVSFYDTASNTLKSLLDTLQWGAQHRIPINLSLPPLGKFIISPSLSYEETWLTRRMKRTWNDAAKKVDTLSDDKGFYIDRQVSFGLSFNTAVYGTVLFKNSKLRGIRHVIRPNFSFNYKPNLSKSKYDVIRTDPNTNRISAISQFSSNNLFSPYGYGKYGGISFGVDNNLEIKWKGKKDTTQNGKVVRIIDGFGFTSGYNFLQDSLKLQPFNVYLRSTLFEKVSLTGQALVDPYQIDTTTGTVINRYAWQGDRFRLARITSGSISLSTQFQSKPRDPDKPANPNAQLQTRGIINDPTLIAQEQLLQDYMRRNPAEFVDFNIPWSLGLSFALQFTKFYDVSIKSFKNTISSNINFNNSFSLTPKWNFSTNGYFDFNTKKLTQFAMTVNRDMHCWQMSISVTPVSDYKYFNLTISPKSSILQDLRVNRTRTFVNY